MSSVDEERTALIAEAGEFVAERSTKYEPFDQEQKLGERPWFVPLVEQWERQHGHDVRLKCYVEFGCQVLDADSVDLVRRLAAALESVSPRLVTSEEGGRQLFNGTAVRDASGDIYEVRNGGVVMTGEIVIYSWGWVTFPATVLWSPAPEGSGE